MLIFWLEIHTSAASQFDEYVPHRSLAIHLSFSDLLCALSATPHTQERLDLSGNRLVRIPAAALAAHCPRLRVLRLARNRLAHLADVAPLRALVHLVTLDLLHGNAHLRYSTLSVSKSIEQ